MLRQANETILLVEDDEAEVLLIQQAVASCPEKLHLAVASDAAEALEWLADTVERGYSMPRMIMLDLKLPKLAGLAVLRTLRMERRLQDVPVVVFSELHEPPDVVLSYQLGANSFVERPARSCRIHTALARTRPARLAERPGVAPFRSPVHAAMKELRILFAATSVDNMTRVVEHLQHEGSIVLTGHAPDMATLDAELLLNWDVLIAGVTPELPLKSIVAALRSRELDIPLIVLIDAATTIPLAEAVSLGAQDCVALDDLERLLPTLQREMVTAILRSHLREQVVTDYLMQEIDQLILRGYDLATLNERICRRMVELFDLKLVWIGARMPDGNVEPVASAGESAYLKGVEVRWDDTPQGQGPVGMAIRGNKPETLAQDSPQFAPWQAMRRSSGYAVFWPCHWASRTKLWERW